MTSFGERMTVLYSNFLVRMPGKHEERKVVCFKVEGRDNTVRRGLKEQGIVI